MALIEAVAEAEEAAAEEVGGGYQGQVAQASLPLTLILTLNLTLTLTLILTLTLALTLTRR